MIAIGIDPGKTGGMSVITKDSVSANSFAQLTEADISEHFMLIGAMVKLGMPAFAMLERVHSSPQMGVASAFTFGDGFGFLRGCLNSHKIPYELVQPQKWQKSMGCLSGGNKNITKAAAQRLYPAMTITHSIADSLLIATYCSRVVQARK